MNKTPKHIGIVGCSSEGAALCYKTICSASANELGEHAHPEVSMHTHSLADYVECLDSNDLEGVGNLMISSAEKLEKQGAEFLICPDNTIHQIFDYVNENTNLPWLHIAEVVVQQAVHQNYKSLGILGTKWLVESDVYPTKIEQGGLSWVRPSSMEIETMGSLIMNELVNGIFNSPTISYFQSVIDNLRDQGCDAVILGCTEIPLIISDDNSSIPTLDSTRLLARAAIQKAIN